MDAPAFGEPQVTNADLIAKVNAEALLAFSDLATPSDIEILADRAVTDICGEHVRVPTFVPLLAMRQIRDWLQQDGVKQ